MNQCVPSWDLDDPAVGAGSAGGGFRTAVSSAHHRAAVAGQTFSPVVVPMSDQSYYEVAELTWEKGNISSHGLLNRPNKYPPAAAASQQLQPIGGSPPAPGGDRETLEAVVSEAAARSHFPQQLQPWRGAPLPADALVPCATRHDEQEEEEEETRRKRARVVCASQGSVAPGTTTTMLALDAACATTGDVCGFTTTNNNNSTSLDRDDDNKGSPDTENTSIGGGAASDSRCFSRRSQANLLPPSPLSSFAAESLMHFSANLSACMTPIEYTHAYMHQQSTYRSARILLLLSLLCCINGCCMHVWINFEINK